MELYSSSFPKLIDDTPEVEDKLGAHKRIANTLCKIIRSNRGGKTIALEGEWGSGKSTVINLMSQELESNLNFSVVIYDAWVHAGDPLRRAYLSSLIDALLAKKWLKEKEYWNIKKEELARRKKDSTKKTTPLFTGFGKALLILLLLLPLASVVFSGLYMDLAKRGFTQFEFNSLTGFGLIISVIFAVLPVVLVLIKALHARCYGEDCDEMAIILNKSSVTEVASSIETPDPTTIEFQEVFKEVITEALLNVDARQLVLVIDNLDRLASDEAGLVWSMLRSFIDNPAYKNSPWKERLWVVVPIAPKSSPPQDTDTMSMNGGQYRVEKGGIEKNKEKFLEKVFQVRLILPPPVLADWKNYLLLLLGKGFGETEKEHFSDIHRIYEACIQDTYDSGRVSPTPRELVLFTNELVTMKIQWGSHFSISYLAAYILSTRKKNVLLELQGRKIPSPRILRLLGETDVTKDFAAIYFNLDDKNRAQQLLLVPIVEQALMSGNENELLSNLKADKDFELVIDKVISESIGDWVQEDPMLFFNAMIALARVESFYENEKNTLKDIQDAGSNNKFTFSKHLRELVVEQGAAGFNKFLALPMAIENCAEGIISCVEFANNTEIEKAIVSSIKRMSGIEFNKAIELHIAPNQENIQLWLNELSKLVQHDRLATLLLPQNVNPIALPINGDLWSKFCYHFNNNNKVLFAFIPSGGLEELERYISGNCIQTLHFSWPNFYAIKREADLANVSFLKSISNSINVAIFASTVLESEFLESLLWTIFYLENRQTFYKDVLSNIVSSGWLHHHFHTMHTKNEYVCAASLVVSILKINPGMSAPVGVGNAQLGQNLLVALMASPEAYPEISDNVIKQITDLSLCRLLIDISAHSTSLFIPYAVGKLENLDGIYGGFSLTSTEIFSQEVQHYIKSAYPSSSGADTNKIRNEIVIFNIFKRNLLQIISQETTPEMKNGWLYSFALSNGGFKDPAYIQRCLDLLKAIDEKTWQDNIQDFTWTVKIVGDLLQNNITVGLGEHLRSALLELARKATADTQSIKIESNRLSDLVNSLIDIHKHSFADDVFAIVEKQDVIVAPMFWEKFGFVVSSAVKRLGVRGRTVRKVVIPMVARGDIAGLKWFEIQLKEIGIASIDDDQIAIGDLVGEAESSISQSPIQPEMAACLKGILELLGRPYKPVATE